MKFAKFLSVALAAAMITVSLASCGGTEDTAPEGGNEDVSSGTEENEQVLTLVNPDSKKLDVNDVTDYNQFILLSHVQEGLFRVLPNEKGEGVVTNAGCESYEVSEDGLTYTFKIRPQKWSDGQPVVAQNYVDSILRLLDHENGFAYSFMAYDILNAEAYYDGEAKKEDVGVKALDDSTLEIKLQANIPFFVKKLTNVCFYPVRMDIIEAAGNQNTYNSDFTKHVFNGPFVISSRILGNEVVLTKNENYWDADNVKLEKVVLKEITETSTQSLLLENKEIDLVKADSDYINKWKGLTDEGILNHVLVTSPTVNYICFNQHTGGLSGLMNNSKIRLALSLAIDREEMNDLIYSGIKTPAYSLIPFDMHVGDDEFRTLTEEPLKKLYDEYAGDDEKLRALFKEGLMEEKGTDDLSTVTLEFIYPNAKVQNQAMLEFFKQTWETKFGIKVKVNIYSDTSLFLNDRNANKYDVLYQGWSGDYDDPMTFFELFNTGSGYARAMGGFSDEGYDELFDTLALESDNAKREEAYIGLEKILVADKAGIAPLNFENNQYFVHNYVKNFLFPSFGSNFEFSRAYISGK